MCCRLVCQASKQNEFLDVSRCVVEFIKISAKRLEIFAKSVIVFFALGSVAVSVAECSTSGIGTTRIDNYATISCSCGMHRSSFSNCIANWAAFVESGSYVNGRSEFAVPQCCALLVLQEPITVETSGQP